MNQNDSSKWRAGKKTKPVLYLIAEEQRLKAFGSEVSITDLIDNLSSYA